MKSLTPLFLSLLLFSQAALSQQDRTKKNLEEEEEDYAHITTFGITTNTNSGILGGVIFRHSSRLDKEIFGRQQYRYFGLELVNVRHPKEISQLRNTGARFIPGKQNYLFSLRPQYGREIVLSNRSNDEGISINGIFAIGASLGILKPYFVQYQVRPGVVRTEAFDPAKHTDANILGAGNILQGLGSSKIVPGINAKIGFSFELSAFRNNLTGIEVGFLGEAFSKSPVIIPFAENRSLFTSGYISLFFGNKK